MTPEKSVMAGAKQLISMGILLRLL